MNDINFRIKELVRIYADGNNSAFAKMIDIDEANVRNYIKGTEPKAKVLEVLSEKLEINAEWLLTGRGQIKKNEGADIVKSATFDKLPIGDQLNSLNEKLEFMMKAETLNRIYLKTIMAHLDIKMENFKQVEEDLERNKKTASN